MLRQRVAELDQHLEQALVAAEDAQAEAGLLVEERRRLEEELEAQRHQIADLHHRLAAEEIRKSELLEALIRSDNRLRTVRRDESHLSEELQTSYEELQVLTEELERANDELERRVEERTLQLAESEARYRTLFEAMDEGFFLAEEIFDADERPVDILYLQANPAAIRMTGQNCVGRRLSEIATGFEPHWFEVFGRAALTGVAARTELYAAPLRTWFNFYVFKVGSPTERRVAVVFQDVTQRKKAEEEMQRAKEAAEAADRAKTKFLAAASHDLRQPIQAAALYAHVLRSIIDGNAAAEEVLDLLRASIDSLNGMLSGLLDLSRLEAGAIEVEMADFAPAELMRRLAAEFGGVAGVSGIDLRCLPSNAAVSTDPKLLERVLRNLLSNAIAHGAGDGDGEGRGRVLFGCRRRPGGVEFQVWDNGPGIPEDAREAIFEEFRQLKNPERSAAKGFGLGLSIVSRIARLLGLEVTVRSAVGRGSVFSVTVPRARAPEPIQLKAPVLDTGMAGWLKGRTVLLVEDDAQVRRGLTLLLKGWGVRVVAAGSTEELASILPRLRRRPHVVLTDHRLPGGHTGRNVVELVRSRWDVPGVIITGDTAPERLREAMSLGCRLLHKPIQPSELAGALGDALDA
ncbi:ATP-binding protein [Azospirillum sp. sgz302134]